MAIKRLKNFFSKYRFGFRPKYFQPFSQGEKRTLVISLAILGVLLVIFTVTYILSAKRPKINSIEPSIALPNDEIRIIGKYLKNSSVDQIYFAGKFLTTNNIISWNDNEIVIKVPDPCRSGFVFVKTDLGRSNGKLFTNSLHIPHIQTKDDVIGGPSILSPSSISGNPGDLVSLSGVRFGKFKNDSLLCLSESQKDAISLSDIDPLAIELWSDELILFRLPDFDFKGKLFLNCSNRISESIDISIMMVGAQKKESEFVYHNIEQNCSFTPKSLSNEKIIGYLDFPLPINNLYEYNQVVKNYKELKFKKKADNHNLYTRYPLSLRAKKIVPITITRNFQIKTKAIHIVLDDLNIKSFYDTKSVLYQYYTALNTIEGDTGKGIVDLANRIMRSQTTTIARIRSLYDYIIVNLKDDLEFGGTLEEALISKIGNAYHYSAIFVSTCKQMKIPARIVEGWYNSLDGWVAHCWSEVYLNGVGWVPVDCWLGDSENYLLTKREEAIENTNDDFSEFVAYDYYFGNLPASRVIFSRGKESWSHKYSQNIAQNQVVIFDKTVNPLYIGKNKAFSDCMGYFSSSIENYQVYLDAYTIQ